MKPLSIFLLSLIAVLCSCNRNDEPPLEVALPITETFLPATIEFDANMIDDEQKRNLIHLVNNQHIVNDASELPVDPMGFSDAYRKVNFKESTLLIKYVLHDYTIDTYHNIYFRNTKENSYNWSINIGTASDTNFDSDQLRFTRFAILVNKLPADANFKSWFGLSQFGWFPD